MGGKVIHDHIWPRWQALRKKSHKRQIMTILILGDRTRESVINRLQCLLAHTRYDYHASKSFMKVYEHRVSLVTYASSSASHLTLTYKCHGPPHFPKFAGCSPPHSNGSLDAHNSVPRRPAPPSPPSNLKQQPQAIDTICAVSLRP